MRPPRPLTVALVVLALSTGCARRGAKAASSPERFVGADASAVIVIPTLQALSQQGSEILATAATFPGGQTLLDGRSVLQGRLGFDPFDAASLAGAGLDPQRGAAVGVRLVRAPKAEPKGEDDALPGAQPEPQPDLTISVPVADAERFDATLTRIAKERLGLAARGAAPGKPAVVVFRRMEGDAVQLAYAVAEQTAVIGLGPKAVEDVRAALSVPAGGHIGTTPAFQTAGGVAGNGLALLAFLPPGSAALEKNPQLADGFAVGLRGARDRLELVGCTLLGKREAAVKAGAKGSSAALLAKLHPDAAIVARGEGDLQAMVPREQLLAALASQASPKDLDRLLIDAYDAIGNGSALGVGLVPVAAGPKTPQLAEAPLGFIRAELLLAVKNPAKMKDVVRRAITELGQGRMKAAGDGPWTAALPGGELAVAVDGGRLMLAIGPAGSLRALAARTGSAFQGPTPTSARALQGGMGGGYADVGKLSKAIRAIPAAAYGTGTSSGAIQSSVQQWATTAARITAVSATSELVPGAQRGTLVVEVTPPPK